MQSLCVNFKMILILHICTSCMSWINDFYKPKYMNYHIMCYPYWIKIWECLSIIQEYWGCHVLGFLIGFFACFSWRPYLHIHFQLNCYQTIKMDLSLSMFIHDNDQKFVIMFSPSPLGEFLIQKTHFFSFSVVHKYMQFSLLFLI